MGAVFPGSQSERAMFYEISVVYLLHSNWSSLMAYNGWIFSPIASDLEDPQHPFRQNAFFLAALMASPKKWAKPIELNWILEESPEYYSRR